MTMYYVDETLGNDNNNGTSQSAPWKTLGKVNASSFSVDDFIYFRRGEIWKGEYLEISDDGSGEGDRIIIDAYGSGPKPIISFGDLTPAVRLDGDFILMKNIRITNNTGYGVRIRGDQGNVDYCEIDNVGLAIGMEAEYGRVRYNDIHDLIMVVNDPDPENEDYGAVGITIMGRYNEVGYNFFRNCEADSHDWGLDGGVIEFNGDVDGANIHHNKAFDCYGFYEAGGGPGASAENVALRDNILVNCRQIGGIHLGGDYVTDPENFLVERNVIVEFTNSTHAMLWFYLGIPTPSQFNFRRNIIVAGSDSGRQFADKTGYAHSDNYFIVDKINDILLDFTGDFQIGGHLQLLGF